MSTPHHTHVWVGAFDPKGSREDGEAPVYRGKVHIGTMYRETQDCYDGRRRVRSYSIELDDVENKLGIEIEDSFNCITVRRRYEERALASARGAKIRLRTWAQRQIDHPRVSE